MRCAAISPASSPHGPRCAVPVWHGPTNVHRKWVKGSGEAQWGINPDDLKGKLPKHLPDVPEFREDFASYLGEIQAFDAQVGVLVKQVEEAGELTTPSSSSAAITARPASPAASATSTTSA
jgi:hypothetical protein